MNHESSFEAVRSALNQRLRPVEVANPLAPDEMIAVALLSGVRLDELDLALVADVRAAVGRGRTLPPEVKAAERRLRIVAAQVLDVTTLEETRPSPRYSLAELRAMSPEDRAKLEALVEQHGHIPGPSKLAPQEMSQATRELLERELVLRSGGT